MEDGEALHSAAPATFHIPKLSVRNALQPGDFAKLVFRISVADEKEPEAVERMWVLVRGRLAETYFGILDNEPDCIAENDEFWRGTELPFEVRHVIAVQRRDAASIELAKQPLKRRWV